MLQPHCITTPHAGTFDVKADVCCSSTHPRVVELWTIQKLTKNPKVYWLKRIQGGTSEWQAFSWLSLKLFNPSIRGSIISRNSAKKHPQQDVVCASWGHHVTLCVRKSSPESSYITWPLDAITRHCDMLGIINNPPTPDKNMSESHWHTYLFQRVPSLLYSCASRKYPEFDFHWTIWGSLRVTYSY